MALDQDQLLEVASRLSKVRDAEAVRLDRIHAAVKGENPEADMYVPRSAGAEYRRLIRMARFNVLPMVVGSLAQALFVDGFRPRRTETNSPVWDEVWQPNRMDARQAGLHRAAIQYGVSYALVLPDRRTNAPAPVSITPYSPRQITAVYEDPVNDEWPTYAVVWGQKQGNSRQAWLYDDERAYGLLVNDGGTPRPMLDENEKQVARVHGVGLVPVVRYVDSYDDLDDGPCGKVEPLIEPQHQLHQTTFSLLMAQQYAAFRQRWATGLAIPEDENGNPIEPFSAAVDRVWSSDASETKFGDFEATDLRPYLDSRDKVQLFMANMAQIPPHNMVVGAGISNISAEALAALESGHRQDIAEHQATFGEGHEQTLRLAGLIMGRPEVWEDRSAEVVWRDTTPRSLGQIMDAWGKAVQMMNVPEEGAWEQLPVSDQTLERWRGYQRSRDTIAALDRIVNGDRGAEPGRAPADATASS